MIVKKKAKNQPILKKINQMKKKNFLHNKSKKTFCNQANF